MKKNKILSIGDYYRSNPQMPKKNLFINLKQKTMQTEIDYEIQKINQTINQLDSWIDYNDKTHYKTFVLFEAIKILNKEITYLQKQQNRLNKKGAK